MPLLASCTALFLLAACDSWNGRAADNPIQNGGPTGILGPLQTVIGVDDVDSPFELFGRITDIAVDRNAHVYVLDEFDSRVRVFNVNGAFLGAAGREGDGPGEFRGLLRAESDTGGLVHVLAMEQRRIHTLELTDSGLVLRDPVQLDFRPQDICAIQGRRFLLVDPLYTRTGPMIREVNTRGQVVNGFGHRESPEGPFSVMGDWDYYVNNGWLACDSERLILASKVLPVVRAFTLDGQELWRQEIPGFHESRVELFTEGPGAGSCCKYALPDPESGTYHVTVGVANYKDYLFVSLSEYAVSDQPTRRFDELRILDARTGEELAKQKVEGTVVRVDSGFIYMRKDEPFPQIVIYVRRESEDLSRSRTERQR